MSGARGGSPVPPSGRVAPTAATRRDRLVEARWLLGCALVVEAAFEFLLRAWSEVLEVLLFVSIIGGFLLATWALKGLRGLAGMVTDTWTQRFAALFLGGTAVSFLWGDQSGRSVLALLRLPTYLVMIAMMVETLRGKEERMRSLAWATLGAVCLMYALMYVEFFWGSDVFGLECADVIRKTPGNPAGLCESHVPFYSQWPGVLSGDSGPLSRERGGILHVTVIATAYGSARLGLFAIAACALGMGIVLTSRRTGSRLIAAGLVNFVLLNVLFSGSRSAAIVIPVSAAAFAVLIALYTRSARLVRTCIITPLVFFAVLFSCWRVVPVGLTVVDRLLPSRVTELTRRVRYIRGPDPAPRVLKMLRRAGDRMEYGQPYPYPEERSSVRGIDLDGPRRYLLQPTTLDAAFGIDIGNPRRRLWRTALDMALDNPVGGVGFRMFSSEYKQRNLTRTVQNIGVHNGYLKVLAEGGLLGACLLLALLGRALTVMVRCRAPGRTAALNVWRVAFLIAFVGMLTVNMVDTHSQDRYFWIVLAFAAVAEAWKRAGTSVPDGPPSALSATSPPSARNSGRRETCTRPA